VKSLSGKAYKPVKIDHKKAPLADEDTALVSSSDGTTETSKEKYPPSGLKVAARRSKGGLDTVLLIICSNRPEYLKRTLEHVLRYHPRSVQLNSVSTV
jgi:hypothetical protein